MIIGFVLTSIFGINNLFIIFPIMFGLLKELYDYKDYAGFSTLDWLFTSLPPFIYLVIFHFFNT